MKDLSEAKQILGMRISKDREISTLKLSQEEYVKRVLSRFSMQDAKPVGSPLADHFKLSKEQCPQIDEDWKHMERVPYTSTVGSLMYATVYICPDIAHTVGVVSRYIGNLGKKHWKALKWVLRYFSDTIKVAFYFK